MVEPSGKLTQRKAELLVQSALLREKLAVEAGSEYKFDKVLVLAKEGDIKVGAPYVEGAAVTASVIGDGKEKKVVVYKYKPKKGFHKKRGHRQPFTKLQIKSL